MRYLLHLLAPCAAVVALLGSARELSSDAPPAAAHAQTATVSSADGALSASGGWRRWPRFARGRSDATIRRLRAGEAGTYIGEILQARDSSLARWPERVEQPVRVWIQPEPPLPEWRPAYADAVRAALAEWEYTGIPVRFGIVDDSARAEVHVVWVDAFEQPISGKTRWARDDDWWILDAVISLAVRHRSGALLDDPAMRAIALHEVGHLLGLDHTADATNIMAPRIRVRDLSDADRATLRLLYTLPAGAVR